MGQSFRVGVQGTCLLTCNLKVMCGGRLVSGHLEMMRDLTRQCSIFVMSSQAACERLGDTSMHQATPGKAGFFIDYRTQFLVAEVVGQHRRGTRLDRHTTPTCPYISAVTFPHFFYQSLGN